MLGRKKIFQFTPLREGRPACGGFRHPGRYFNSRPSARGDVTSGGWLYLRSISIHAPPRGATRKLIASGKISQISIHAPPRGATKVTALYNKREVFQFTPLREGRRTKKQRRRAKQIYFNSRPSARGDALSEKSGISKPTIISIHAPPRGATSQPPPRRGTSSNFNSRPSARGDKAGSLPYGAQRHFNSRPSARGD